MLGSHTARQCPAARRPHPRDRAASDVTRGALCALEAAAPFFPAGTVHLAVVDPGVGTRAGAVWPWSRASRYFVGPDNGLFTPFSAGDAGGGRRWRPRSTGCAS